MDIIKLIENVSGFIWGGTWGDTVIIPGHGPVSDRDGLMAFRDMLKAVRANVAAAMDGGKSVEDVVAAKPTSVTDAKWGNGFLKPDRFTQIVYSDLAR